MGLGQSQFNAGAANQANGLNLESILGVNAANQGAANNAGNQLASYLMQNYGLDMSAFTNILNAGLGGNQSLNTSGLSGQLGLAGNTATAQNNAYANGVNNWMQAAMLMGGG
jgi:hypothetical protein